MVETSPGVTFARHVSVTSVEWNCMTLRALHEGLNGVPLKSVISKI